MTRRTATFDPPEGKEERGVKYYMSNMPSLLAEEVNQLQRDIKSLLGWLHKNQ
jgi:hypothetical protein